MSMGLAGLHTLLPILGDIPKGPDTRILLLGNQDLTFTYDQAKSYVESSGYRVVDVSPDERRTTNSFSSVSHEDWWKYKEFIHQETLFTMLGFGPGQTKSLDVDDYENADILHDLNKPIPPDLGQYDLVVNQGTMEHVFDVKQFLWNLSDLTKIHGQVLHLSPAGFLDHGFYNLNPCLFADFYAQSGWQKEELYYTLTPLHHVPGKETYARLPIDRLTFIPEGFYLNLTGRFRKAPASKNCIAVQGLYVGLHEAWNHQSRDQSLDAPPLAARPRPSVWRRLASNLAARRQRIKLRRLGAEIIDVPTQSARAT